ncbi:hypothetical protein PoB_005289000 [Plakobranchus ocellatus]|uniref:Uncharacterized protein n=1 Tax=Plakobranchus ocellatus TaxID=259542 RepID=A0AAV4C4N7_9GAST|nr:hypothetical protein PoB_005289000 [Plakobranchus ocellatus]
MRNDNSLKLAKILSGLQWLAQDRGEHHGAVQDSHQHRKQYLISRYWGGFGGPLDSEPALRSAWTILSRVRATKPAPWL